MCPGTSKVARLDRNEGTKMQLTKLLLFIIFASLSFLSISSFSTSTIPIIFLLFLFLSRPIIVNCDGSVYHIDVDIDVDVPSIYLSVVEC